MAISRLWLFNTPSGAIDRLQMAQMAIGYPIVLSEPIVPTEVEFYSTTGNVSTSYSTTGNVSTSYSTPGNVSTSYGKTQDASHTRLP